MGWMWQPRGAGTGTLPSCPLNGNQMGDYIFKHNRVSYYYALKSESWRNSPYPFTGVVTHCSPHTDTPPPPHHHPHSIASWQEWQHCRWTNRFQLRSHLGCLIWDKSRCASPKAPQANSASHVHGYHDWSCWKFSWAMSDSLWAETGWVIIIIVNNDNDNKLLLLLSSWREIQIVNHPEF